MEQPKLKRSELLQHFLIRPIQLGNSDEEQAVVDLIQTCYRSNLGWTNEAGIVRGQRITLPDFRTELSTPKSTFLVAEERDSGRIVGCVKVQLVMHSYGEFLGEQMGHLGMFAVAPRHQGKGLGSYFMTCAEEQCREWGMSKMLLEVLDIRTNLIGWYERRGYRKQEWSLDATQFIKDKGEMLLVPTNFIRMIKEIHR